MIEKLVGAACLFAAAFVAERAWGRRERRSLETLDCAIRLLRFFHRQVSTVGRPVGEIWRTVPEEIWCGCTGGMTERHERCLLAAGERFCDEDCRRAWEELLREVRGGNWRSASAMRRSGLWRGGGSLCGKRRRKRQVCGLCAFAQPG